MPPPDDHIKQLASASLSGDESSRNELMAVLEPILRAFFVSRIGSRVEVDDLVQNTLVRVHQSLAKLREPASVKAFAMKGALFELHDYYRGRYRGKEMPASEALPDLPADAPRTGDAMDIDRALDKLTPHARRILELREYGFRYAEIAEMVGSTEPAIKMQVKRAFERMKDLLVCLVAAVGVLLIGRF